jgi:hypothetical protein
MLKGKDNLEDLEMDGKVLLDWLIAGVGFVLLIGFIWHRTGTGR